MSVWRPDHHLVGLLRVVLERCSGSVGEVFFCLAGLTAELTSPLEEVPSVGRILASRNQRAPRIFRKFSDKRHLGSIGARREVK